MRSIRLWKSTPDLRKQSPLPLQPTTQENDQQYSRLEKMIEGWEKEYYYMDHPVKLNQKPRPMTTVHRPPSNTPTIDKILLSLLSDD